MGLRGAWGEWEVGEAAGFGRVLVGLLFLVSSVWEAMLGCSQVAEATFSGSGCLRGFLSAAGLWRDRPV